MKQTELLKQVEDFRKNMDMSSKIITISGISSILMSVYALIGSFYIHKVIESIDMYTSLEHVFDIFTIAVVVLLLSIMTGIIIAKRNAIGQNQPIWNIASKLLLSIIAIPLLTGAGVTIIMLIKGYYSLIPGILLLFYGLSLVSYSFFSSKNLKLLGFVYVVLGLTAMWFTKYGLFFIVAGFGLLHLIYGIFGYLQCKNEQAL